MADAGSGIGTHREGRQERSRQAKQAGASGRPRKKASKSAAAKEATRTLGKTEKHTSKP
jgi:hypothetical protein